MTYTALLEDENIEAQYLAVLKPKRRVTNTVLVSGSTYSVSFPLGPVVAMAELGVSLTLAASSTLTAGQFYWDEVTKILYVRLSGGGDPDASYVVATYELYVGTTDGHWYADPLNTSSRDAYFEPIIKKSPAIKQTQTETLFGYMPKQSSQIVLSNAEHTLEPHLYNSTFSQCTIKVYHWLGKNIKVANIALVYDGIMGNVSYDSEMVSIKTYSFIGQLDTEFRNPTGDNFFGTTSFPLLDPQFKAKPIRQVYGRVDGFVPVNIQFKSEAPTTSDNRNWVVCAGQTGLAEKVYTVAASPASTTTRTYLTTTAGLNLTDTVKLIGGATDYREVTVVNRTGSAYIEHPAIGVALTSGQTVRRGFVSRIDIVKNNINYVAYYDRDYICTTFNGDTSGITFNTTLEANLSLPTNLTGGDRVSCRVYGRTNDLTLGGPAFGANDSQTGNIATAAQIIYDILKRCVGIPEASIDATSFGSVLTALPEPLGVALPSTSSGGFENYKTLLLRIMASGLIRLLMNDNNQWELSNVAPMGAATKTVGSDEIRNYSYDFDYGDLISEAIVEYNAREVGKNPLAFTDQKTQVSSTSNVAKYLHGVRKSKTFESLHIYDADAQKFADRLSYLYGDQIGEISVELGNRFYNDHIGGTINLDRTAQPSFDFDGETTHTRKAEITALDKTLKRVTLTMSDNKGVEDNSTDW